MRPYNPPYPVSKKYADELRKEHEQWLKEQAAKEQPRPPKAQLPPSLPPINKAPN
jgi:hypothetical protein